MFRQGSGSSRLTHVEPTPPSTPAHLVLMGRILPEETPQARHNSSKAAGQIIAPTEAPKLRLTFALRERAAGPEPKPPPSHQRKRCHGPHINPASRC